MSVGHVRVAGLRGVRFQRLQRAMKTEQQTDYLLRLRDVIEKTSLSRSTIYRRIDDRTFPKPVKVGDFAVRWKSSAIDGWITGLSSEKFEIISGGMVGGTEIEPLEKTE
jgi:prophage regulatory protein